MVQQQVNQPVEVIEKDIRRFQESIRNHSEYDFTQYSLTSLRRRLTKILLEYDMDMGQLTRTMEGDPGFLEKTVRKVTVHTTELFRDPGIWDKIRSELIPLWKIRDSITIWHPGCSTGQEIYSMMMVLEDAGLLERSVIFGSDLNPDALEAARKGRYKYLFNQSYLENFEKVLPHSRWDKYFTVDEARDVIQMRDYLCSKPVYNKLDLVKDPNLFLVKFDLIVCRNVIIYFNSELQNRVFNLFHENLVDNGVLLLGVHESIMGPYAGRFLRKDPFYRKQLI